MIVGHFHWCPNRFLEVVGTVSVNLPLTVIVLDVGLPNNYLSFVGLGNALTLKLHLATIIIACLSSVSTGDRLQEPGILVEPNLATV